MLPRYGIDAGDGPIDFATAFARQAPVWMEIGFGNGAALVNMATQHPEIDFVGVEVHPPGVGRLLNAIDEAGLSNVRVIQTDASEVLHTRIGDESLARVLVFFPDPWPKKRHHKRRIIQPPFVREVARTLERGGILHLATDWEDYAWHMREVLDDSDEFENTCNGWARRPDYRPRTRFEQRGEDKGHTVHDLMYRRV